MLDFVIQRKRDKSEDEAFAREVLQILLQGNDRIVVFDEVYVAPLVVQEREFSSPRPIQTV